MQSSIGHVYRIVRTALPPRLVAGKWVRGAASGTAVQTPALSQPSQRGSVLPTPRKRAGGHPRRRQRLKIAMLEVELVDEPLGDEGRYWGD
jgi:hypothetical protein